MKVTCEVEEARSKKVNGAHFDHLQTLFFTEAPISNRTDVCLFGASNQSINKESISDMTHVPLAGGFDGLEKPYRPD